MTSSFPWRIRRIDLCFASAMSVAALGACDGGAAPPSPSSMHTQTPSSPVPTSHPTGMSELSLWNEGMAVPPGAMVADRQQAGTGTVALPASRKGVLTLRVACHGPGGVALSDSSTTTIKAKTIIMTKGCEAVSPIGAGLPAGWRPARVTVTVAPGTLWRLGAWIE